MVIIVLSSFLAACMQFSTYRCLSQDQEKHPEKPAKDTGRQQKPDKSNVGGEEKNGDPMEVEKTEIKGSMVDTLGAERPPESTIHTHLEHLHLGAAVSDIAGLSDIASLGDITDLRVKPVFATGWWIYRQCRD